MKFRKHFAIVLISLIIVAAAGFLAFKTPESSAGSSQNLTGWAWSSNVGWISFNSDNEGRGADYGVNLDLATGKFSGYAWSSNIGWITFNFPIDEPNFPNEPKKPAQLNLSTNNAEGWARAYLPVSQGGISDGGWDGWIKMSGIATDNSSYGVKKNGDKLEGYAWGGAIIGWINFYDVKINSVSPSTLDVSLAADTNYAAQPPLNGVDLTAGVVGSATGPITYAFYCNRSDTGTDIASGWAVKFDSVSEASKTAIDVCDYSNNGTYTAKVVVQRAGLAVEARTTIVVGSPTPPPPPPGDGGTGGGSTAPILYIIPPSATIDKNSSSQLLAYFDSDGTGPGAEVNVTAQASWSSSDISKATVTAGYVTTKNETGSATISASYNSLLANSNIVITDPYEPRIIISDPYITVSPGDTVQIKVYFDSDGAGPLAPIDITDLVEYSVSDPSIATVSSRGLVTGISEGVVYITISYTDPVTGRRFVVRTLSIVSYSTVVTPACQALNPKFTWSPPPAINKTVKFTATSNSDSATYEWSFPNGTPPSAAGKEVSVKFNYGGKSIVSVRVSDGINTCVDRRTVNIGGRIEE